MLENHLYPGISELLRDLAQIGQVCLATSKPQVFAEKILETRGVRQYFSLVVGAELSGERTEKGEVIEAALQGLGDPPRDWAVMIGDRKFDVEAGRALGLVTVGRWTTATPRRERWTSAAPRTGRPPWRNLPPC